MILLRNGVVAFLKNGGQYLLMKRADNRRISPGVWSGVGGHMEPDEIDDPLRTCYREIQEETGIARDDIPSLTLRYIITRRSKDEIRQTYIYFGETTKTDVIQTDEGVLHWIPEDQLLNRPYTQTFAAMLAHYVQSHPNDDAVVVGVAQKHDGKLQMSWSRCEDFD